MKYESTNGVVKGASFQDVMLSGYADDGGMFLPECIPEISLEELRRFSALTYAELCKEIVKKFSTSEEYTALNIDTLIEKAFSTFDCKEIVPVKSVGEFHVAELWHGKSLAFKDLGISCLAAFTEEYLRKRGLHANLTCATSGDTGSAIMEHVKGSDFIDVFTLYPEGRCHNIQELQMACIEDSNVHTFCAQGTSDDFDTVFQVIYEDKDFVKEHNIISFNSLNWLRILIQMTHYIYSYLDVVKNIGDLVTIVVPSGGLGNLTAGYFCYLMGVPIKLVAAVNQNAATHHILSTGIFSVPNEVLRSSSCSMDIAVPYNFQRLLYLATNRDNTTARLMQELTEKKVTRIPDDVIFKNIGRNPSSSHEVHAWLTRGSCEAHARLMRGSREAHARLTRGSCEAHARFTLLQTDHQIIKMKLRQAVQSATVSEDDVKETIKKVWDNYGYHVEPHTAVAASIALDAKKYGVDFAGTEVVVLACASPQKFPEVFQELGVPFEQANSIKQLLSKEKHIKRLREGEDWITPVKAGIVEATKKFRDNKKK
eukprot:gene4546-20798_t